MRICDFCKKEGALGTEVNVLHDHDELDQWTDSSDLCRDCIFGMIQHIKDKFFGDSRGEEIAHGIQVRAAYNKGWKDSARKIMKLIKEKP